MINPNGDDFIQDDPLGATSSPSTSQPGHLPGITGAQPRLQETARKVSAAASETWEQTKEKAGVARERAEFYLRENPVPTIIGALALGLVIGLAIRYGTREEEVEVKTSSLPDINLSALSLPFLWPLFKSAKRKYEDSADAVKDGVSRLKKVDVDDYVKPIRKRWNAWTS